MCSYIVFGGKFAFIHAYFAMAEESGTERYLRQRLAEHGGECIKVGHSGWPDRVVVMPGNRHYWVELKASTGSAMVRQRKRLERLQNLGCTAFILDSKVAVDQFVRSITCTN